MTRPTRLLVFAALVLAACATGSRPPTSSTATSITTTSSVPTTAATTTTEISTTTTTSPDRSTPGEPVDFGPMEGDRLMVIGVSHEDSLNLRDLPGTDFEVVAQIPPDYRGLVALGNTRDIGPSFWLEVDYEGTVGWVHMGFVGLEGATDDVTAYVAGQLGGRPSAASMEELGMTVLELFASKDPSSELVLVVPESIGDVAEATYDVIGLGDDSIRGIRVHLFAEPFEGGFLLRTVEVTTICGRGVTEGGLCA